MKRLVLGMLALAALVAAAPKLDAIGLCETQYGYTCKTDFGGPYCSYSSDPNSVCSHDATKCGCGAAGGDDCDPNDRHCVLNQDF